MSVDLNQFKRQLIYQDQASSTELANSINQIRDLDHKTERLLRAFRWSIGCGFAGMLAAGFGGVVLQIPFLLPLAVICGIVFVAAIIAMQLTQKFDLSNRRYELLQELTGVLSRDMPKDAQFKVTLDLAPPNHRRKKANQDKVRGWDVTFYEDPWLRLEGRFADGTSFDISMLERFQARKKHARSRSGKTKLKSKTKAATVATVKLYPKLKRYANLGRVTDQTSSLVRLPDWVKVKKVTADQDTLMIAAVTSADWSVRRHDPKTVHDGPEIVITMLLSLYQVLHTSNAISNA